MYIGISLGVRSGMKEQVKYVVQHWNYFNIQCSETCPYIFNSLLSKCYRGDFAYLRGAISTTTIPYKDIQLYTLWQICAKSVMFIEVLYFLKMNLVDNIVEKTPVSVFLSFWCDDSNRNVNQTNRKFNFNFLILVSIHCVVWLINIYNKYTVKHN